MLELASSSSLRIRSPSCGSFARAVRRVGAIRSRPPHAAPRFDDAMSSYQTDGGPGQRLEDTQTTAPVGSPRFASPDVDSRSSALLRRALLDVMLRWIVNSVLVTIALCVLILMLMQSRGTVATHSAAPPPHPTAAHQPAPPSGPPRFASESSSEPISGRTATSDDARSNSNSKIRIHLRLPRHAPRVPAAAAFPSARLSSDDHDSLATLQNPGPLHVDARLPRHAPHVPAAVGSALFAPDYPDSPATPQNPGSHHDHARVNAASEDGKYMWLFFLVILLTVCACGQAIASSDAHDTQHRARGAAASPAQHKRGGWWRCWSRNGLRLT